MPTDAPDVHTIRRLLENLELTIVLDTPDNDYRFEYSTTQIKDRQTGEPRLPNSVYLTPCSTVPSL